ncbi:hypothetical protein [Microcoleus sp. F4-D5]|uniref:hypothetical protein n=1 Tax=Microcoleus sp. F4-D5 TaxID=2818760 RepID=UPI002FD294BD
MINPKNNDENNDVTIAGTDLFADSESFLNELTDSELVQIVGGGVKVGLDVAGNEVGANLSDQCSTLSLLLCEY